MKTAFLQWIISRWKRTLNSIAFYPGIIATIFLGVSILMVFFDASELGKDIKSNWKILRLRDASTARSIISAIAAGIISLTVFSFSMVMIVLNQAASQMSNRVLDKLIGNRFQQLILGFYIGTIVYALFLLSTIRDIDEGIYVPSISTYLLILLTVMDIFLFIYFLHYITQSVKYEIIIARIHEQTRKSMEHTCRLDRESEEFIGRSGYTLPAPTSGIFTSFNRQGLLQIMERANLRVSFLYHLGDFVLKDAPFLAFSVEKGEKVQPLKEQILLHCFISDEENIDDDFFYGLRQLMEVAIRALSPSVNDPATAITSLRALTDLLAFRLKHHPSNVVRDKEGTVRITTREFSFEQVFNRLILPIWDYGKNDRLLQNEMRQVLLQLASIQEHPVISRLLQKVQRQIVNND